MYFSASTTSFPCLQRVRCVFVCARLLCRFHCGSPAFIWTVFCITTIASSHSICETQAAWTKERKERDGWGQERKDWNGKEVKEKRDKKGTRRNRKVEKGLRGRGQVSAVNSDSTVSENSELGAIFIHTVRVELFIVCTVCFCHYMWPCVCISLCMLKHTCLAAHM